MSEFALPEDLSKLTRAELAELKAAAQAELDVILERDPASWTLADAARVKELTTGREAVKTTLAEVDAVHTEATARQAQDLAEIEAGLNTAPDGGEDDGDDTATDLDPVPEVSSGELVTAAGSKPRSEPVLKKPGLNDRLRNASLREAQQHQSSSGLVVRTDPELIITASADIPGFAMSAPFPDQSAVADAFHARARSMPVTHRTPNYAPVATIKNQFATVLNDRTPAAEVEARLKALTNPQNLFSNGGITTAGGGWCAPSVNRYDFFDVSCEDGMIDLPTVGIERGGINFPTSPSMADVFTGAFDVTTNPWLWTETDDVATVTGSPNKPCVRVPCPSFTNVRLECYGICLTAGNLTDNAYPEATQHQIRLLNSAHFHASNARYISQMLALSTAAITGGSGGAGVISPVLYMIELAAEDYRTRFGMCQNDVLEVVLPHWVMAAMRADATKRQGGDVEMISVTDNVIADWLDLRKVRAQFVSDWQVRASGLPGFTSGGSGFNTWPTSVQFMIYAAGTFVKGNGMSLNLGVVRDSTLNAENDHTALWMEECHLIARFGFQSRLYTVNICADGTTGAADLTACTP